MNTSGSMIVVDNSTVDRNFDVLTQPATMTQYPSFSHMLHWIYEHDSSRERPINQAIPGKITLLSHVMRLKYVLNLVCLELSPNI